MIRKIDAFLIEVCETTLKFLNDWLGITQRQAERFLHKVAMGWAGATLLVSVYQVFRESKAYLFTTFMIALTAWIINFSFKVKMRMSSQARAIDRYEGTFTRFTCLLPVLIPTIQLVISKKLTAYVVWNVCFGMIYLTEFVFVYVIVCNVDGERSRKAKLAWDKIKELFGTHWIPQPVGVGR